VLRKATAPIRVVARANIELPKNVGGRFGLNDASASTCGAGNRVPARTIIS
jgi:hypothetical protein